MPVVLLGIEALTDGIDERSRDRYRERTTKPREIGITVAIGECMEVMRRNTFEDMVASAGDWLD